jgi:hypothetical protein
MATRASEAAKRAVLMRCILYPESMHTTSKTRETLLHHYIVLPPERLLLLRLGYRDQGIRKSNFGELTAEH